MIHKIVKLIGKISCGLLCAACTAAFGPILLAFALMILNALFGVPIDFLTAENPIISDIFYPIMTTGLLSILPLFFLMLSAIAVDDTLTIREKGKELAANHTAEQLTLLYKQTQELKRLNSRRFENLRLAREIAKKASGNEAIIFDAATLMPISGTVPLESAYETADMIVDSGQKYGIIPVAALMHNFKTFEARENDEFWEIRHTMDYLEYAIALKSTAFTESSIETTTDIATTDITVPDSTTTPTTESDPGLLMQTS